LIRSNNTVYREKSDEYAVAIGELQRKLNGMSLVRVIVFAALAWDVYEMVHGSSPLLLLLAAALAGLFIFCINLHFSWKEKRRLLEKLRFVNENELQLLAGGVNSFPDGQEL
jgi:hypothetical protein